MEHIVDLPWQRLHYVLCCQHTHLRKHNKGWSHYVYIATVVRRMPCGVTSYVQCPFCLVMWRIRAQRPVALRQSPPIILKPTVYWLLEAPTGLIFNKTGSVRITLHYGTCLQRLLHWNYNTYYTFWMRVSSLRYPACCAHVACPTVQHFSTLSHERQYVWVKKGYWR